MQRRKPSSSDAFTGSAEAAAVLRDAQWHFGSGDGSTVYEIKVQLAFPGIFPPAKADVPLPGLPTLDGFLSFVAFRAALQGAMQARPDLAQALVWQWNAALRGHVEWVNFDLPLRTIGISPGVLYDCSIGLPVVDGDVLVPAGAFYVYPQHGPHPRYDLKAYPDVVDSLPLRRRVAEPMGKPLRLKTPLNASSGKNKALDNRVYYALTQEYVFYFRGDPLGVERLLKFAHAEGIGMGKKTTLGYGSIESFAPPVKASIDATLALPVLGGKQRALIKSLPYQPLLSLREGGTENRLLFGCDRFRLVNALETVGAYRPPYWRRDRQTQILQYGTVIMEV